MNGASEKQAVQVLIVDDNQDAAMSLMMLLELEDISASSAPSATAALDLLRTLQPQVLLIDIGLPGMNGYELANRLRQRGDLHDAKLIALTGRDAAGEPAAEAAVFDQFWTKPFDPKKLLSEVRRLLGCEVA